MECRDQYAGMFFHQVSPNGRKTDDALMSTDVYVAGDMVTMADYRICWPYVSIDWDFSQAVGYGLASSIPKKMSVACMTVNGTSV